MARVMGAGVAFVAVVVTGLPFLMAGATAATYGARTTAINRVGLNITNYGFIGTNFNSKAASFEFPLGTGFEHMSRAGLWVGATAFTADTSYLAVSTAAVDNAQGTSSTADTEFTPIGDGIAERSRIPNSTRFSRSAISDQDLTCEYADVPARGPSGQQTESHSPLNILVRQKTLVFSLPAADAFVVQRYTIVNRGRALQNLYVGQYAQLVSGSKNAYGSFPPSTSNGPQSWYYQTHVDFDRDRRMYKEHYCARSPYPTACNFAYCPPWAGVQLLGVRPGAVQDETVSFNWWSWVPGDTSRDEDVERYRILSNGLQMDGAGCVPGGACSPVMVLSVGPFEIVNPNDSVVVDFAFVGGEDEQALGRHADFAQFAYDIDYKLPSAPPSPSLLIKPGHRRVDIYWDSFPETAPDSTSSQPGGLDFEGYRVYLGIDRQNPAKVAQFDVPDTTGFNNGLDVARIDPPLKVGGVTYSYRFTLSGLRDGFSYYGAVTSYDTGDDRVESLESNITLNKFQVVPMPRPGESSLGVTVFPNPYRVEARWDQGSLVRDHYLWFANLPAHAVLRIFTLSGDQVFETRFDGATYRGAGARGLYDPRTDIDTKPPALAGASYAWDLITSEGQAIASGLYLYSVEDLDSGHFQRGKFLVAKSDREK